MGGGWLAGGGWVAGGWLEESELRLALRFCLRAWQNLGPLACTSLDIQMLQSMLRWSSSIFESA